MTWQSKAAGLAAALIVATAGAHAPARADTPTGHLSQGLQAQNAERQATESDGGQRLVCQRVRRCRRVVGCMPYFSNPWNCYRSRSCRTVRECYPVGRGTGRHEF
jgi:hypothetical protein